MLTTFWTRTGLICWLFAWSCASAFAQSVTGSAEPSTTHAPAPTMRPACIPEGHDCFTLSLSNALGRCSTFKKEQGLSKNGTVAIWADCSSAVNGTGLFQQWLLDVNATQDTSIRPSLATAYGLAAMHRECIISLI